MSWLVETLLLNREEIRAYPDFDSDDYNNLLIIERTIDKLIQGKNIVPFELAILNYVITNKSYSELEALLGISRETISKYFRDICNRISYSLGGEFTDEGYLDYMATEYNLEPHEIERIRQHINSKYRHSIRRIPHELN